MLHTKGEIKTSSEKERERESYLLGVLPESIAKECGSENSKLSYKVGVEGWSKALETKKTVSQSIDCEQIITTI